MPNLNKQPLKKVNYPSTVSAPPQGLMGDLRAVAIEKSVELSLEVTDKEDKCFYSQFINKVNQGLMDKVLLSLNKHGK